MKKQRTPMSHKEIVSTRKRLEAALAKLEGTLKGRMGAKKFQQFKKSLK